MTRQEHLNWCKKRALDILKTGNVGEAGASFLSDMGKHEETARGHEITGALIMRELMHGNKESMKKCIEGFN